jgi:hypothetical protein
MINLSRAERVTDPSSLKDIPGPGYYSSPTSQNKPSHVFNRSDRAVSDLSSNRFEDIPGPGAYMTSSVTSSSTHRNPFNSSSARFQSYECKWKPGPGSYHSQQAQDKKDQKLVQTLCIHPSPVPASIPLLERHELAIYDGENNKVSPADYNPKYEKVKPRKPASLFSKSKIQKGFHRFQGSENLGPGCYHLENDVSNSLNFQVVSKTERFKDSKSLSPGPGSYNPNMAVVRPAPGCFVSKLERKFDIAKKIIQERTEKTRKINQKILPNAVFASHSQRDCNRVVSSSPLGPGRYNYSSNKKEGFQFPHEIRFKDRSEDSVGPGSYDPPELPARHSPINLKSARFGDLSDLYVHSIGENKVPGPGNYEISEKSRHYKGVSFDLSSTRKLGTNKHQQSPDPGQYYVEGQMNSGPRIGAEVRFKSGIGSYIQPGANGEFIGPGSYKEKNSFVKRTYNISWI